MGQVLAPDHDLKYSEDRTYIITKKENGEYGLSSEIRVSVTPLTRRATKRVTYAVHESFYAPVKDLEAHKDGDSLSSDDMEKITAQGQYFLFNDQLHLLKFKSIHVGQTVSWTYRQEFSDIDWLPWIRLPNKDRVEHFSVTFKHPPEVKVDFDVAYPRQELRPRLARTSTQTSITFAAVPHVLPLKHFLHNERHATIWPKLSVGTRSIAPVSPTEYTTWHLGLYKPFRPFSAEQKKLIGKLTSGSRSDMDRVKRLYDWVRSNVRYLADERGINGLVARDPSLVLERRYGDCKDLAYLVIGMAGHVGAKVEPVLVGVGKQPPFKGVHNWTFNHVIGSYSHEGGRLFLDPTCEHCEFTNLPEMDVEMVGLVLSADRPEKLILPPQGRGPSVEVDLHLSPGNLTEARAEILLRNSAFNRAVWAKKHKHGERLQAELSKLVGAGFVRILFSDFKWGDEQDGVVKLTAKVKLDQFLVQSSGTIFMPKVPFNTRSVTILTRRKDPYPIHLNHREHLLLRVHFPAALFSAPPADSLELGSKESGTFRARIEKNQDEIVLEYFFHQRKKFFTGEQRDSLLELYAQLVKNQKQMFSLSKVAP